MKTENKLLALILLLSLLATLLVSCKNDTDKGDTKPNGDEETSEPYTFLDSNGTEITLKEKPKKVAVLFSSYVDIWEMSGSKVNITVGDSVKRGLVKAEDVILVDEGSGHSTINNETLIAEKPDLIIGTTDYSVQVQTAELMNKSGIPMALFKVESHTDFLNVLKIFCEINGTESTYTELEKVMNPEISSQISRVQEFLKNQTKKDMLFIRAGSSDRSTKAKLAKDHFACKMLEDFGLTNIAENKTVLLDGLSIEEIIESDPYYIFVTFMGSEEAARANMDKLLQKDGYKDLTAVKEGRVYYLSKDLYHYKPNARWAEAYTNLADLITKQK